MKEECRLCKFWSGCKKDVIGLCRRHPPVVIVRSGDDYDNVSPETVGSDWCGEWEERK